VFEDCFRARKANSRTRLGSLLPLIISVVLHVLLVYGLYHARFPIKVLKIGPTVRNIVIGPSLASSPPKVVGPIRPGAPAKGLPTEEGPGPEAATSSRPAGRKGSAPPPPAPAGQTVPGAPGGAVAALASKFQQSLASRLKTGQESEFTIILSPPGSKTGPASAAAKGPVTDFYSYIPGPVRGAKSGYGTGPAGGRRGTGGSPRAGISIPLKGYDLTPWAQKVLEVIQKNWDLPLVGNLPDRTRVRIILMISKSGDISSLEVVEGSILDVLDQAALKAIRASLPLPALPADFPGDFLEAHFEFTYHD
jgi:TonB family protein